MLFCWPFRNAVYAFSKGTFALHNNSKLTGISGKIALTCFYMQTMPPDHNWKEAKSRVKALKPLTTSQGLVDSLINDTERFHI